MRTSALTGSRARALALALALALAVTTSGGCGFAVKHPAVTGGLVVGSMTLGACELETSEHRACLVASGGAGLVIGLIAAGALWLGSTGEDSILQPPPDPVEPVRRPAQARPGGAAPGAAPGTAPGAAGGPAGPAAPAVPAVIPDYLKEPPQLFARSGESIVPAPPGDQAVAATYAKSPVRGPLHEGARITILTERTKYKVGEEVRVIHVLEAPEPGRELYVMGPKPIYSEYVDGALRTPPPPPVPAPYDGRVVPSPGADFNYEVTTYRFTAPGPHRIQWRDGGRESNVIELEVTP
jgi:hypothetical protein